eukprot:CAMPEP_0172520042 /NCGR_PEP_ID=MMETSP1066-20121228/291770_1 /TAXON_ID=671091 /ORGANISM="Coscinodiscus wailesii, Strain CCMP2513" /LENGTH=36 /DNA_ID= /DNA_START= /DNA_END= /DNA_ORIENTATION=
MIELMRLELLPEAVLFTDAVIIGVVFQAWEIIFPTV